MALEAGQAALLRGLPGIARRLLQNALETGALSAPETLKATEDLARTLLSFGRPEEAERALTILDEINGQASALWRALAHLQLGNLQQARDVLDTVSIDGLSPEEILWRDFALDLLAAHSWESAEENTQFRQPDVAPSSPSPIPAESTGFPNLATRLELLRERFRLRHGLAEESLISTLRAKVRDMAGQRGGYEAARLLAVALYQSGRREEAVSLIERQLTYLGSADADLRPAFLLLLAAIVREDSARARYALQEVMLSTEARTAIQEQALLLLDHAVLNSSREVLEILDAILTSRPQHPLADRILILRATIHLAANSVEQTESDARTLIENFPASPLTRDALRLLAFAAWKRTPPQFRTAANYLNRLRENAPDSNERTRLAILAGDCYFLDEDYASAEQMYFPVVEAGNYEDTGRVVYQWLLSLIRQGKLIEASNQIDLIEPRIPLEPALRWQAEWNILNSMEAIGQRQSALQRIRKLRQDSRAQALHPDVHLRLGWLETRLLLHEGQPGEALQSVRNLSQWVQAEPESSSPMPTPTSDLPRVANRLRLQEAECLLALDRPEEAAEVFQDMRATAPNEESTVYTYLIEARYLAAQNRLVDAQRKLIALADGFSQSPFAAHALWEAASLAAQRGTGATYQEAIGILERLRREFPAHPLRLPARLRQGDLSRLLNDFAAAQLIYETILNETPPGNPLRLQAELSRADCLFAQGSGDPAKLQEAASAYERVFDLVEAPTALRAEAGYKWAQTAPPNQETPKGVSDILWLTLHTLLIQKTPAPEFQNPSETPATMGQSYWLARAALDLADLLEKKGEVRQALHVLTLISQHSLPGQALARAIERRLKTKLGGLPQNAGSP